MFYSVDSTASQQESEDTSNDYTFTWMMLYIPLTVRTCTISNYYNSVGYSFLL